MSILLQILFAVLAILVFLVVYSNLTFTNYLKLNHNDVWKGLNKPSWSKTPSREDQQLMKNFLDKGGYLKLNDPKLNSLVGWKKKVSVACILVLCLYGGMFLKFALLK